MSILQGTEGGAAPAAAIVAVAGVELSGLFDATVQETNTWLAAICDELNQPDRRLAFDALRAVLLALRDRLTPAETLELAAQLPLLVRGVFIEGYAGRETAIVIHGREQFFRRVGQELGPACTAPVEAAARAVLNVVEEHVSRCKSAAVRELLARALQGLWG